MTSKFLLTLPLAAALVVPVWAQQTPSSDSSSTPQMTQSQTTAPAPSTDKTTQANPNGHEPLAYERHEGFWGHLNPFARKKYVQRQLDPVRGRLNELDEITAQNAKAIKDVDARATEGIRVASLKANEADMHAVDAGNRAQLANQTAQQATVRLNSVEHVVEQHRPVPDFHPGRDPLQGRADGPEQQGQAGAGRDGHPAQGPEGIHHRSAGLLRGTRPGRRPELAADGTVGGALPGAERTRFPCTGSTPSAWGTLLSRLRPKAARRSVRAAAGSRSPC